MALNYNNPGNIRLTSENWIGQVKPGDSTSFATFTTLPYGYRALFKLLTTYINQGFNNLSRIIYKYAPPGDSNPTISYLQYVESRTGIDRLTTIYPDDYSKIWYIGLAISRFETGEEPDIDAAKLGFEMVFNDGKFPTEEKPGWPLVAVGLGTWFALMLMSKR